jgi:hypothetical protein
MKISQLGSFLVRSGAAFALVVLCLVASPALQAATIEISFTGMNLVYDGSAIYDAGSTSGGFADPADADPLSSVVFSVDGSPVGTVNSNVSLDLFIPGVSGIPSAAGTVHNLNSAAGGFMDLLIGTSPLASEFLLVDLDEVNITYVDVLNVVQFAFGAAISDTFAQNLPFNLVIGDPVTVSFSAQVSAGSLTSAGGFVTGFSATGTGEIRGPLVPEPATCMLAACGLIALVVRRQ